MFRRALLPAVTFVLGACAGEVPTHDRRLPSPGAGDGTGTADDPSPGLSAPATPPLPAAPTAVPSAPPVAPRSGARLGVMDCPTVPLPPYRALDASAGLSVPFQSVCASCHGADGRGRATAPDITAVPDLARFTAAVRRGAGAMPAFDAAAIGDAQLHADFAALRKGAAVGAAGAIAWTSAERDAKIAAGMVAWRAPDAHGAACASCHAPDAIDLAVIGYDDWDIRRRALAHVTLAQAQAVVDLVHAQRQRFGLGAACDPRQWRPLQPGGRVVEGDTPLEQELNLQAQLAAALPTTAVGRVDSPEKAKRARDEWLAMNPRRIRILHQLPLYTEDRFHGPAHSSINDWLTSSAMMPARGKAAELQALHDQYLADPGDQAMARLLGSYWKLVVQEQELDPRSYAARIMRRKYRSVLLLQHVIRRELLGRGGLFDAGPQPFPGFWTETGDDPGEGPLWLLGRWAKDIQCKTMDDGTAGGMSAALDCLGLPASMRAEVLPRQRYTDFLMVMSDPWFTLHFIWEPAQVGQRAVRTSEYWRPEKLALTEQFFIGGVRTLFQTSHPGVDYRYFRSPDPNNAPPILDGSWLPLNRVPLAPKLATAAVDGERRRHETYVRMVANTIRTLAFLMKDALVARKPIARRDVLVEETARWQAFLRAYSDAPAADLAVVDEVRALLGSAKEIMNIGEAYEPYCKEPSPVRCTVRTPD